MSNRRPPGSPPGHRARAPLAALALATALVAGAGAQEGPSRPSFDPFDSVVVEDTTRPAVAPAPAAAPTLPDSVAFDSTRAFLADSLVADTTGLWRVSIPRDDSLAQAEPLDRSTWISWTPRLSRLALPLYAVRDDLFAEDEPWHLRYPVDARAVSVAVDPAKGTITQTLSAADVNLAVAREVPLEDYARDLSARSLRAAWVTESRRRIDNVPSTLDRPGSRGALSIDLPFELPKAAQGVLGRGGPSLNVSGSERISISGTSNWDNRTVGLGQNRSLFPSLDMRQDLDIKIDGSLGDKVRIDVAQNSANTVPLANRIGIHYLGYEDEILKSLDLGNTNLSLPGTQYVSYSGRNEGLFGVKAAAKVGGTDIALIASKQEGRSERRSFQGTAQEVVRTIDDLNYVKGKYFFLQRPSEQLATSSVVEVGTVKVYLDDQQGSNNQGLRTGTAEVDPTQPPGATKGFDGFYEELRQLTDFQVSTEYYGERFPVLVLRAAISSSALLAVTYDEILADGTRRTVGIVPPLPSDPNAAADPVRLKLLQAPRQYLKVKAATPDYFETDPNLDSLAVTRDYEIKSFYDLQTMNIDPKSLQIQVRRYDAAIDEATDAYKEGIQLFPYIQVMGVDLFKDNGTGAALEGPDQIVDQFQNASFLDLERGVLFFPDLRPFDPRITPRPDATPEEDYFFRTRLVANTDVPGLRGRVFWPAGADNPPGLSVPGPTPDDLESNPTPYDKRNIQLVDDRRYYIWAKFTGQDFSGTISLGQVGILEGSEVVAIEGVPLEKNKDYQIDYDAGVVTLLTQRARENRSRLTIDYSYAPLFAQAGKTLVGGTMGYRGPNHTYGGAFIYESKGQDEPRPRLGEEPAKTLIGDLYGEVRLQPYFLTDLVDRLPFYNTTEPSQFDINGELGVSLPNPNTRNTVYLDDFEGNRDSYSAPMGRGFWKWASIPRVLQGAATVPVENDYAEMIWYNPVNTTQSGDLNPRLTRGEGAENYVTTLDLYVPKEPVNRTRAMWSGVTTTVEPDGADFSRLQYLELWLNDWVDPDVRNNPNFKLHIDLGVVSEDAQRAPGQLPNGTFDTEDKNLDGKYDPNIDPLIREDTGADGIPDEFELADSTIWDLSTATSLDPHGDNWRASPVNLGDNSNATERLDPQNYVGSTLSEKSKGTVESGNRLFTEDLDGNQTLDTTNDYVTFTLPLGDEAKLAPFIISEAATTPPIDGVPVHPNNGWRRFRIPLDLGNPEFKKVINGGTLATVKHLRVWMEGIDTFQGIDAPPKPGEGVRGRQPLLQVAAIEVVGNRWRLAAVDDATKLANGSIVARNVNNQEDRNVYSPPFGVETTSSGGTTQTQREQSIALEVNKLPYGSTATIFKDQTLAEDYTRYGRLAFYQAAFGFRDSDSVRVFLRFGYDDRNYYEYSRPIVGAPEAPALPTPWGEIGVTLKDFTDVKLDRPPGVVADTTFRGAEQFIVVGSPTFTRVQRLTIGVYSERAIPDTSAAARSGRTMSGQIWIDELRALDVDRSRGTANRLTMFTKIADLMTLTTNWDRTDENFQRLGQTRPTDVSADRLSLSGTFQPHRFLTGTGINLPISFAWARTKSTPRLRTGTDLILEGEDALNEQSQATDRSFGVTLSKTGDRNPIIRNTIGRMALNFSYADRLGRSPIAVDSTRTMSGGVSYSIAPAEWFRIPVPLWKQRGGGLQKLKLLPETANIAFSQTTTRTFTFKRALEDPVGLYSLQSDIYRKQSVYTLGATWRPLPLGSYSVGATRNAYIPGIEPARIFGVNFGRMTNFNQRIDGRLTLPIRAWFRPSFDFSTSYTESRTPDLSPDLSLGVFSNATNGGVTWELPFTRLAGASRSAQDARAATALAQLNTRARDAGRAARVARDSAFAAGDSLFAGPDSAAAAQAVLGTAAPPPTRGFGIPVGKTLSRLGNITMRLSFARTTGFGRYTGVPSVPYRLGLVRDPDTQWNGDEVQSIYRGAQATDNAQRNYSGDASTTVQLIGRATARLRANYSNLNRVYNGQLSNSENVTFPDVQFEWGQVHGLMKLGKVFSGINAQSRASWVTTREGVDLAAPASRVKTRNYRPLLQLSGQTKGSANVQLSIDKSSSKREDFSARRSIRNEGETSIRSSISRAYQPGQKLPIFGGSGLKSTLTLSLDGTYAKRSGSTEAQGASTLITKNDRLDLNSSATYSFSNYVNGTLGLGFSQNRDLYGKTSEGNTPTNRSIRLEASAAVRF